MKKSVELRKELAAIETEMRNLLDSAKVENRDLNETEQTNFDAKFEKVEALKRSIDAAEKVEKFEARQAATEGTPAPSVGRSKENYSILGHINAVRSGKLEGVYKEAQDQAVSELRAAGVSVNPNAAYIPSNYRDFSVTGDSGTKGGKLVGLDKTPIIESLFEGSLLNKLGASRFLGLTGNLDMPKGGSVVSTWRNENQAITASDHNIGAIELRPNRLATRMNVSNQLLIQSSADVEAYLRREIEKSIQKALDEKYIEYLLGSSDVKPIVNGATGAALTYEKIQEFISEVGKSEADVFASKFLINWDVFNFLKTLPKASGSDQFVLQGDRIDGFEYVVSNRVPNDLVKSTGEDLSMVAFGDFASSVIAGWGAIEILVDPYTAAANGQTVMNVGSYWDIKDMYPEGKSVSKDVAA
jgi:HK97 family phage major capsid protein